MTTRYGAHGQGRVGISYTDGRLVTWGSDSLVKAWPNGIAGEHNQVDKRIQTIIFNSKNFMQKMR
jgi:hypothetical protein